jgi:hypothetical protein
MAGVTPMQSAVVQASAHVVFEGWLWARRSSPFQRAARLSPNLILLLYILHLVLEFNPCTMVYSRMQTLGIPRCGAERFAWSAVELNRCFSRGKGCDSYLALGLRARERRPSAARMPPDDPFSVLGVRTDASVADVKTAYRSLGTHRP